MVLMHQTLLPNLVNLLVECRTSWGEPERVHVQNMEQLHAHDRYQNVTEHKKPQATVHETKSTDMHNTDWLRRLASLAGMPCTVCMVAACTQG